MTAVTGPPEHEAHRERHALADPAGFSPIEPIESPEAAYNNRLGARITAGAHVMAVTTAAWIRLIGEFDARDAASSYWGINSTSHFLSVYCSLGASTAREHVRVARALESMPLIGAAFDAGRVSYSKVRECARVAGQVDEAVLLEYAQALSAAQLEASIRTFRRTRRQRLEAEQARRVSWSTGVDGAVTLRAVLPAEEGARVVAALESAHERLNAPVTGGAAAGARDRAGDAVDAPTAAGAGRLRYTRADALLEVADGYLSAAPRDDSGADRHLVVVHVGAPALATATPTTSGHAAESPAGSAPAGAAHRGGPSESPASAAAAAPEPGGPETRVCAIAGLGSITPATARRLACDAAVQTLTLGPDGHVLNLGRARRFVTRAQRRALIARDSCCQWPGCARTRRLDAHHIVHWAFGGVSDLDNYILLCPRHHTLVHEASITITKTTPRELSPAAWAAGDRWAFTRVGGQVITAEQTTRTIACDYEHELPYGEREMLNDLIADVHDLEHPFADAIRPTWGGERGGGTIAADGLLENAARLDERNQHEQHHRRQEQTVA